MSRKLFAGPFWLVLGGCGSTVAAGLLHGWLGAGDSEADRDAAARKAAAVPGEAPAPATAREAR